VEPLLNPARPKFRWWESTCQVVWQLEAHAMPLDGNLRRLSYRLVDEHPALRRHIARWQVPPWDVLGYESLAEGPWPQRRLVALFPREPWIEEPKMLCLDGPQDSLHRNGPIELCLYYERDPEERRWTVSDGLVRLFDLGRRHLMCEYIWRKRGRRPSDWPTAQAPHGYGPAAPGDRRLLLDPELPLTADGRPTGGPFR
jgi:hypothetical protein